MQENNCLKLPQISNEHCCWKMSNIIYRLELWPPESLSKSKCWYSNTCLYFLKHAFPLNIKNNMQGCVKRKKIFAKIFYQFFIIFASKAWGGFVEQKLVLSCYFRCDQIYNSQIYEFGHTLLCYLSLTWMFNKPASGVGFLNI